MGSIAVTGPRTGMTSPQVSGVTKLLHSVPQLYRTLREGGCVGADHIIVEIARDFRFRIVEHPPVKKDHRAWATVDEWLPPLPYLDRNRVMVDTCSALLATPGEKRSRGTWYTIDYAARIEKATALIWPDGRIELRPYGPIGEAVFTRLGWVA